MIDIATRYLGLELTGPVIASCSPLTGQLESLLALQQAGASAVVLPSLFQEEVEAEELAAADLMDTGEDFAEFASAPVMGIDLDNLGVNRHVNLVEKARQALNIPVIASINGTRPGDWARYAQVMQDAGAHAIELNLFSVNADPHESSADAEQRYLTIIEQVKAAIDVPLAVKLSQHFTALSYFAAQAEQAGADALVLFNRFYGADINLDQLEVESRLQLSTPDELRYPLRWIGILRAQRPDMDFAATSGIHTGSDVLKALLVGASVACTASAVLHDGPAKISAMLDQLGQWMDERGYESVDQLRGSMSAAGVEDPSEFERAQYMKVITSTS